MPYLLNIAIIPLFYHILSHLDSNQCVAYRYPHKLHSLIAVGRDDPPRTEVRQRYAYTVYIFHLALSYSLSLSCLLLSSLVLSALSHTFLVLSYLILTQPRLSSRSPIFCMVHIIYGILSYHRIVPFPMTLPHKGSLENLYVPLRLAD